SGWLASFWITNNYATWRIKRLTRHTCEPESETVCQCHMAIETIHKDGSVRRKTINQFFGWKSRVGPAFMIPIATLDPASCRQLGSESSYALSKFLLGVSITKINA